ncbi:O-methyltransferase [Penicillium cataractarum]|uniref:O-methyltransferase n=1 Tax=Penicillium cataractarum TaxID=2100454 RepID=A0A9W9SN56_9EURO|nr:O-methyltransferase [Penicillium cataractarum]KAJ5381377.1 O-methyltransferase [Penicillium cataractarum]
MNGPGDLDNLLSQLCRAAENFKRDHNDLERLAALKAARKLVQALETPQEGALLTGVSPIQVLCVRIAIDIDIFTTLTKSNGPVSLKELAAVKNADPSFTERVLRVLAGIGYVIEHEVRVYAANAMTRYMSDPGAVAVLKFQFDVCMPLYSKAPEYFRETGFQTPLESNKGLFQYVEKTEESIWSLMSKKHEDMDGFYTHMAGRRANLPIWVDWFPVQERIIDGFEDKDGSGLLVDVAGGRGHDLERFRAKFPSARGRLIVEDLPQVLEGINSGSGIECQPIDLFEPQPVQGARAYYMKFVLHDWADRQSQQILQQLKVAMKKGYSKLLIEEVILADKDAEPIPSLGDWMMLAIHCGMERTQSHWEGLLTSTGFRVVRFWNPPSPGQQSIIEAEVA